MGARGDHLPLGGTVDTALNVNQLDPKYMALGSALNATLPNPFFGVAAAGPLSTQATLTRAQLLRPYPQFLNVSARQVSEGINRYNAAVVEWTRRTGGSNWFGGRVSYTYSVLKDNQFGEGNFFSNAGPGLPLNSYSYIARFALLQSAGGLRQRHRRRAPSRRPCPDSGSAVRRGPPLVVVERVRRSRGGRLDGGGHRDRAERIPDRSAAERQHRHVRRRAAAERRRCRRDRDDRRLEGPTRFGGSRRGDVAQSGRVHDGARLHVRQCAADLSDVRTPPQQNVDLAVSKNIRLGGTRFAQIRVEVVNLLNRVTTAGIATTAGNASFGQISGQSGFMRLTQFSFRYSF